MVECDKLSQDLRNKKIKNGEKGGKMKNPFLPKEHRKKNTGEIIVFRFLKIVGKNRYKTLGSRSVEFIINKTVILERGMVFFIRGEGIERDGFGEVWGVFRVSDVCVEDRRCIENKEEYKARFKKITLASVGGPEVCMRCGMHINASKDVPLMWAVERERVDSVKYILRYRINDHVLNEEILNTAASTGNLEILELLCNYPGVLVTPDMIAIAEDYNHQAAAGFLMKKLEEQTRI